VNVTTLSSYTTANIEAVLNRELDAAFINLPVESADERLVITMVDSEPIIAALNPEHPLAQKEEVTCQDLRQLPLVFWPRQDAPGNWLNTLTSIYGPDIPEIARFEPDDLLLLEAVAEGSGYVPVPQSFATWMRRDDVAFRSISDPVPVTPLGVCWLAENTNPAFSCFRREVAAFDLSWQSEVEMGLAVY
jgi:DNA-binding transcriptional LysR family regulator